MQQSHASRRARRRPGPRPRLREPRLPARRAGHDQAPLRRQAVDRLPARVPRPQAQADCSRAGTPSSSSSTRQPHSQQATGRAASAGNSDYETLSQSGTSFTRTMSGPTRSTGGSTPSGSSPARARSGGTRRRSTGCPTARSSGTTTPPASCSATGCCAGRPRATRRRISPAPRQRCRADAAVTRRRAPGRLAGSGAAAAPVGGSPGDRLKPVAVTPPARCALTSEPGCARDSPRHCEMRWSCCRRSSCSRSAERSPAPPGGAQTRQWSPGSACRRRLPGQPRSDRPAVLTAACRDAQSNVITLRMPSCGASARSRG